MNTAVVTEVAAPSAPAQKQSALARIAARYNVSQPRLLETLKNTAFKTGKDGQAITDEQMTALLIVADQYNLNPFTKEIYAFPDKRGGIVPVVGVDGWSRLINSNPNHDGIEFTFGPPISDKVDLPEWCECTIYRKDRTRPTVVREYMVECKRTTDPWQSHPRRMLRHKAEIQCARVAYSYSGIYEQDEAERIIECDIREVDEPAIAEINETIRAKKQRQVAPADDAVVHRPVHVADAETGEIVPQDEPLTLSFAQVEDMINSATDTNALDLAVDSIDAAPEKFHGELRNLAKKKAAEIEAGIK